MDNLQVLSARDTENDTATSWLMRPKLKYPKTACTIMHRQQDRLSAPNDIGLLRFLRVHHLLELVDAVAPDVFDKR